MRTVERLSYFDLYVADYLLDTPDLSLAEHGAYCTLMFRYYWQGCLKASEIYRSCRSDADRSIVDSIIARYFHIEGERVLHNRIERELARLSDFVAHQSKAGKASAEARAAKKRAKGNGAAHPDEPRDASPIMERIPIIGGEFSATQTFVAELTRLYPAVDVPQTLREIRGWCIANPTKVKTARGVKKFVVSWIAREQDKPA
jgi:uncharacterized protein YdaU (DUF1376 family)